MSKFQGCSKCEHFNLSLNDKLCYECSRSKLTYPNYKERKEAENDHRRKNSFI